MPFAYLTYHFIRLLVHRDLLLGGGRLARLAPILRLGPRRLARHDRRRLGAVCRLARSTHEGRGGQISDSPYPPTLF